MQAITKKEVSCKALELFFNAVEVKNLSESLILQGIPYDVTYLKNKRERVEWWVYCKMVSNLKRYCTPLDFEDMGSSFVKRGSYFEGLLWAFFLFTSSKFSQFLVKSIFQIGASMFSCMRQQTEFLAKNKIRITAFVDEGYEYCPEFFFMCKGVWEELGTKIGQKNFKVVLNINEMKGVFDISWNEESLLFKIKRQILWIFNIRKALLEVTDAHEQLLRQYENLEASQKTLQKQTTQLKTAYQISTAIRQSFNINDTLKAIDEALVNEAGFSAAYIDLSKDIDEHDISIKFQLGVVSDFVTPIQQEINVNDKKIGELIVYPKPERDYRESKELLEYLTPVINIAIHDALVLRAVTDYRDNLEQKVVDRTLELRKAHDELTGAHQIQNRFFTNISHEFRTPLTLILGPAKRILQRTKDEASKIDADLIHRSAKKLNRLVDELLDISKIEAGEMKMEACPINLVDAVRETTLSFYSLAERKKIALNMTSNADNIIAYIDKDKFEKILNNVLSNAFKFTPEGGKVEISVTPKTPFNSPFTKGGKEEGFVEISIHDTGIGIHQNEKEKIFDRFYQVDGTHTRDHEGTGIGLSLTKELIELHKGKIEVESEEGKGSTFRLLFPLGKSHLRKEEICEDDKCRMKDEDEGKDKGKKTDEDEDRDDLSIMSKNRIQKADLAFEHFELETRPSLLIVEDNPDVRKYVRMILEDYYAISEAVDGEDGLQKSLISMPDLIITDIMMPRMDGFQLSKQLKTDSRTSHVPIIMLTAKATLQDKVSGLEIGADDYIMKPFEPEELKARIKNLLEQRKRLHEHFRKFGFAKVNERAIASLDKEFIQRAVKIINEHISDTSFGVESLAENMAVGRSLLLKKMEALIGEAPVDLIKRVRLNKAAELIESHSSNISEIALEVGFNNPSYFAEAFKKQFGVSPSKYHSKS